MSVSKVKCRTAVIQLVDVYLRHALEIIPCGCGALDEIHKVATMALMATKTKVSIVAAKEAKNRFGELLDTVQRQPVIITKKGRPVARMIAFVDPKRFKEVEDTIWVEKVRKVMKNPQFLGSKKSEEFMSKLRKKHALSKS